MGQQPFKQVNSSESVGFVEFQKHSQFATMFWLYDNLGFEMLLKISLAPSVAWTVSMLKFHKKDTIDFYLYDNTNDFIRINVALSSFSHFLVRKHSKRSSDFPEPFRIL